MLAHRQGAPLSMAELARSLGVDAKTVSRYLDLLVDLGLVLWSVTKLQQDFRWVLEKQQRFVPSQFMLPPPVLAPGVPPVISPPVGR